MENKFINIDFKKVKGFNELTLEQQKLFIETYKFHNSIVGTDYKEGWVPVKVKWIEKSPSRYSYLRVEFKNGDWLHYTQKKEWY